MARLVEGFSKMPGIGVRSAQRMAFHILQAKEEEVDFLIKAVRDVKANVSFCKECGNLSDTGLCSVCSDGSRDHSRICVVESPSGVIAMEKSGAYNGLYHVLLGALSPIDGVGPEDIKIKELLQRAQKPSVKEVIIATDFTTEGETTALFIQEILKRSRARVTRLSGGVPSGASVEYADVGTLQRAFEERRSA
jgi:recombination protein RecR